MLSQPPSREDLLPSYSMRSAAAPAATALRIRLSCRQPSASRPHSSQGSLYQWLSGEVGMEETERHSVVSNSLQPHGLYSSWNSMEWVDFPFSRGSSQPRDQTQVSHIAGRFFTLWATREAREWRGSGIWAHKGHSKMLFTRLAEALSGPHSSLTSSCAQTCAPLSS